MPCREAKQSICEAPVCSLLISLPKRSRSHMLNILNIYVLSISRLQDRDSDLVQHSRHTSARTKGIWIKTPTSMAVRKKGRWKELSKRRTPHPKQERVATREQAKTTTSDLIIFSCKEISIVINSIAWPLFLLYSDAIRTHAVAAQR
jgi:hypothetical protein